LAYVSTPPFLTLIGFFFDAIITILGDNVRAEYFHSFPEAFFLRFDKHSLQLFFFTQRHGSYSIRL